MQNGSGLAEALLGLDGFRVLTVQEGPAELVLTVESTADFAGCTSCGVLAEAHDRLQVDVRDLPCFGRPARLVWLKRRWRCKEVSCPARTWTKRAPEAVPPRALLTVAAAWRRHACSASSPSRSPLWPGSAACAGGRFMEAVKHHGTPLVEDPCRVGPVRAMGIDETNYQSAKVTHPTIYATAWSTSTAAS